MRRTSSSWQVLPDIPDLLGRKTADWFVFEDGIHIPQGLHEAFAEANGGELPPRGTSTPIHLDVDGRLYGARLMNADRKGFLGTTLQLRYDSNEKLKTYLRTTLNATYTTLSARRSESTETTLPTRPEYLDFFRTGKSARYRVETVPAGARVDAPGSRPAAASCLKCSSGPPQEGSGIWFEFAHDRPSDVKSPLLILPPETRAGDNRPAAPSSASATALVVQHLVSSHLYTSYKPVALLCILEEDASGGKVRLDSLADRFVGFYLCRLEAGLVPESSSAAILQALSAVGQKRRAIARQVLLQSPLVVFAEAELLAVHGGELDLAPAFVACLSEPALRGKLARIAQHSVSSYYASREAGS